MAETRETAPAMWVLGPEQQGAQLVEGWGTAPKSDPFRHRRATPAKARIQRLARAPRGEPAAASSEQIPQRLREDAGADGDQSVGKVAVGIVEVWAVFARAQEEHRARACWPKRPKSSEPRIGRFPLA